MLKGNRITPPTPSSSSPPPPPKKKKKKKNQQIRFHHVNDLSLRIVRKRFKTWKWLNGVLLKNLGIVMPLFIIPRLYHVLVVHWVSLSSHLTHWGQDNMLAILQMTFSKQMFWKLPYFDTNLLKFNPKWINNNKQVLVHWCLNSDHITCRCTGTRLNLFTRPPV